MAYGKRKRSSTFDTPRKRMRMQTPRKPTPSAKRRYQSRRKNYARKTSIPKFIKNGALPMVAYTSHTAVFQTSLVNEDFRVFCNFVNRSSAVGANGVHDDNQVTTVVPSGYDLMYTLYDECRIYGSKIEVYITNFNGTGSGYVLPYVFIEHGGNQRKPINNAEELTDTKIPGLKRITLSPSGTPGAKNKLFKAWTEKMMSHEERVENTFDKGITQTGAKERLYSFKVGRILPPGATPASGYYMVKVTYNCKWRSPHTFKRDTNAVTNDAIDMNEDPDNE